MYYYKMFTILAHAWRVGFSAVRLTRAVVVDDLGDRVVQQPLKRLIPDEDHALRVLASCPWCVGFWITLAVVAIEYTPLGRTAAWRILTTALAAHYSTTHLAAWLGEYDED